MKTVGATVLCGLWVLGISGICIPNPGIVAIIVSEISAFIRTDGQTVRRTDGHG